MDQPHAHGIDFVKSGSFLFHTTREDHRKLASLDVSDPSHPVFLRRIDLPQYSSNDVTLFDAQTVLVNDYWYVIPVDVSDPSNPALLDVQDWDYTDPPQNPAQLNWVPDGTNGVGRYFEMERRGGEIYLASPPDAAGTTPYFFGLRIYDAPVPAWTRPGPPLGAVDLQAYLDGLALPPALLAEVQALASFVPGDGSGLRRVKDIVFSQSAGRTYAFVAYPSFVVGIDVTVASQPSVAYFFLPGADYDAAGNPTGMTQYLDAVEGITISDSAVDILFISTSNRGALSGGSPLARPTESRKGILAMDVTDPANSQPFPVASYSQHQDPAHLELPERLLAVGSTLYAVGLEAVPPQDQQVSGVPLTANLAGRYFSQRTVLQAIDISFPASGMPQLGEQVFPLQVRYHPQATISSCRRLVHENGVLYVGDHTYGLRTFNDAAGTSPLAPLGARNTVAGESNGVILRGADAYVLTSSRIFRGDVSDPSLPRILETNGDLDHLAFAADMQNTVLEPGQRYFYDMAFWGFKELAVLDFQPGATPRLAGLFPVPQNIFCGSCDAWQVQQHRVQGGKLMVYALVVDTGGTWAGGPYGRDVYLDVWEPVAGGGALQFRSRTPIFDFDDYGVAGLNTWVSSNLLQLTDDDLAIVAAQSPRVVDSQGNLTNTAKTAVVKVDLNPQDPTAPYVLGRRLFTSEPFAGSQQILPGTWHSSGKFYRGGFAYLAGAGAWDSAPPSDWDDPGNPPKPRFYVLDVSDSNASNPGSVAWKVAARVQWEGRLVPGKGEVPPGSQVQYTGITLCDPTPFLVVQAYTHGIRLFDVGAPPNPALVWTEPFPRSPDLPNDSIFDRWPRGQTTGWEAGIFRAPYLHVPRLDHVDIFRLARRLSATAGMPNH